MHIAIVGAGAIGSFLAAALARSGSDVTLVSRGERLAWLQENPLAVESDGTTMKTCVSATGWRELIGPIDFAILCTKTGQLPEALDCLSSHLAPGAAILTLQNGVEAPYQTARAFPEAAILAGRVHGFFEMDGQSVRHVGVPPSLLFGSIGGACLDAQSHVAAVLDRSYIASEVSNDIVTALWDKLMLVAGLSGVALALGVGAGQVCQSADGEAMLRRALGEVATVGRACGASLDEAAVDGKVEFVRSFPEEATTSLQRDVISGMPSEYDALIGAVLRIGKAKRVALPIFSEIHRTIRPMLSARL